MHHCSPPAPFEEHRRRELRTQERYQQKRQTSRQPRAQERLEKRSRDAQERKQNHNRLSQPHEIDPIIITPWAEQKEIEVVSSEKESRKTFRAWVKSSLRYDSVSHKQLIMQLELEKINDLSLLYSS